MDYSLVEMASKQTDVLFNLFSLKMKYLIRDQTCESCQQAAQEWVFIRVCHNTLCEKCFEHLKSRKTRICPVCNITLDPKQDIITSKNMKKSYSQIEKFIFSILSLEKGTSDVLYYGDGSDVSVIKPDMIHMKSVKLESDFKEENKKNCEELMKKLRTNEPNCLHFNKNPIPIDNMKVTEYEQDFETTSLNELQFNNSAIDFNKNNSQDYDTSDEECSDNGSNGFDSDDNLVYGTPDKSLVVLDPKNVYNRKDICITYSNFNANELNVITTFYKMFKVRVTVNWSDEVTHLVIKPNVNGTYARTRKCINAILSHCSIVTDEWVIQSINKRSIQLEQEYMPLDESGEASALQSWRIGRGIINSSMLWVKRCSIYFHSSVVTHAYFSAFKGWALKVGFTVIERMEEFKSIQSDLRIILTDFRNPEEDIDSATYSELMNWLKKFKAITVHLDWYLDILCRYRLILIEPQYQVLKLNYCMIELADISESMISIEHNNYY